MQKLILLFFCNTLKNFEKACLLDDDNEWFHETDDQQN